MVKDYRGGMDIGRDVLHLSDMPPHRYTSDEVIVVYGDSRGNTVNEDAFDGFLHWVWNELNAEKVKQEQPLFRHKVILIQSIPNADSDIQYMSNEVVVTDEMPKELRDEYGLEVGDEYSMIVMGVYTALRSRNPTHTRKSFSAGDDMWDELGDLL